MSISCEKTTIPGQFQQLLCKQRQALAYKLFMRPFNEVCQVWSLTDRDMSKHARGRPMLE